MPVYRDKRTGRWIYEFDRYVAGVRRRTRKLLPAGTTRAQAEAYDRAQSTALYAIATGAAKPRHRIDEAVRCYLRERAPSLKHGANVERELEQWRDWWSGRWIEQLPQVCAEYAADQAGALQPATIKNRIAYLRAACRWSWKRHGMADADPGARVVVPAVRNERQVYATREQMLRIAKACQHRGVRAMIRCLWYSGLRISELRAAQRVPGAFVLTDSKNGEPRSVPIHPRIRAAALLPVPRTGTVYYWWPLAREAAGMAHMHIHDLRHSAASELRRAHVDLATIGDILGHRSAASTKRYAHLGVDHLAEAVGRMGRKSPTT